MPPNHAHTFFGASLVLCLIVPMTGRAQTVEDFEGYTPAANIIQHPDLGSFLIPGNVSEFTFHSGLVLSASIEHHENTAIGRHLR